MQPTFAPSLALVAALLCVPTGLRAQDAFPANVDIPLFVAMGASQPISGYVRNASPAPLTGFNTGWRWNNGPVQKGNYLNLGAGLSGNNMAMFTHPVPFEPHMPGKGTLKVWVEGASDGNRRNDTLTFQVTVLDRWVSKRMLMEVRTSLNCHNCQMARPKVDALIDDPNVIVAKFHHRDDITYPAGDSYFNRYTTEFTPAGVIDQGEYEGYAPNPNASQWHRHVQGRSQGVSPVLCWSNAVVDTVSGRLHVTVGAEFTATMQGDFTVNALVKSYNVYAPGEGKPWHHGVVRAMLAGPDGDGEVIPERPVPGTTYLVTYEMAMPEGHKVDDLCITGFVTRNEGLKRHTLNASEASVARGRVMPRTAWKPATVTAGTAVLMAASKTPRPAGEDRQTLRLVAVLAAPVGGGDRRRA